MRHPVRHQVRGEDWEVYRTEDIEHEARIPTRPEDRWVDLEGRYDSNDAGMQYAARTRFFPEIFQQYFDPSALAPGPAAPEHLQAALLDVFGDAAREGKLKLHMHPFFKRWALWERVLHPESGEPNAWQCVSIFMEKPVRGRLPADLDTPDKRFWHLRGALGEARLPTKRDFEIIAKGDKQRHTAEAIVRGAMEEAQAVERAEETKHEAYAHDMLGHAFNAIRRQANRDAGSGWNPISHPARVYKQDTERYERVQKNGFVVIRKRQANEITQAERERLAARLAEDGDARVVAELERERLLERARATKHAETTVVHRKRVL